MLKGNNQKLKKLTHPVLLQIFAEIFILLEIFYFASFIH